MRTCDAIDTTDEAPVDGSCTRCGQNIPAWLTFTLGRGGRIYCSEYCQRLDEQSREIPDPVPPAPVGDATSGVDDDASEARTGSTVRKRLRFLSRLR